MTTPTPKADQNRALREAKFEREQARQRHEKLGGTARPAGGEEVIRPRPKRKPAKPIKPGKARRTK
ncbi:hypothetical protein [Bradyrhizobium sp. RT10b]|uniref:hypothetical protein n=1 Tax=Bradyrhizobium sp. RT10b TaxID=3156331 RepID=UPI00339A68A0